MIESNLAFVHVRPSFDQPQLHCMYQSIQISPESPYCPGKDIGKNTFLQKYVFKNLAIKLGGRNGLCGHAVMYQAYEQSAPWTIFWTDRTVMF